MSINNSVQTLWKKHWQDKTTIEESGSFYGKLLHQKRLIILQNLLKTLSPTSTVLDMGCGGGTTMSTFHSSNFHNIIGIDFTQESMERCKKINLVQNSDVFLMDAKNTTFKTQQFDIVFSEGLWEHFTDPRPYMAEAARIAKSYIIVIQPDHFSFFGFLMHLGWNLFSKHKGGVKEYSFPLSYFKNFLKLYNFDLILSKSTPLHEQSVMVFKRNNNWQVSQQHEKLYVKTSEKQLWRIPYSLTYWKFFLNLNLKPHTTGAEIGCGNNGIYNYASNVIGLDTLNFHKSNFIQASSEHLPFTHLDFAILCNSLDHCQNPQQVLKEASQITNKLILWTYTYPKLLSFFLSKTDKMHPHHFTNNNLKSLLKPFKQLKHSIYSPLNFLKYTQNKTMKIKLTFMFLFNVKGHCIHLRRD